MKLILRILLVVFVMMISMSTSAQEWVNTWGPEGGAILEVIEHGNKLYGRTGTNVYFSENGGANWSLFGGDSLLNITPGSLKSTSFGIHFTSTATKVSSIYDDTTIVASAEGFGQFEFPTTIATVKDTLYAVAGANLYKSIDGAGSWSVVATVGFGDLVFGAGDNVYTASTLSGIQVSKDGGITFQSFGPELSFELLTSLVQMGDKIVFSTNQGVWAKNSSDEWEKTFTETGSFASLANIDGNVYGLNGSAVVVDGEVVSTADVYVSADTGKTWTKIEIESETRPQYGDHNKVVAVGGKLYATAIQKSNPVVSDDGGLTWTELGSSGLKNQAIRGIFPIDDDIYVTTNDGVGTGQFGRGVFKSSDNGENWDEVPINVGEAHNGSFYTIRKNGTDLYACSYAGLFISSDGGATWNVLEGTEEWYISDIHFTDNAWIMAGGDGFSRVWTSIDSGANWEVHYQGIGAVFEKIHEGENGIVIGSNTALIASSQDNGANWHFAVADSGLSLFGGGYYDVVSLDSAFYSLPSNEDNIYKSTSGGKIWSKATNLSGLTGVALEKLFSTQDALYIYGTRTVFEGGVFSYPKEIYKSEDGINFEKVIDVVGVAEGYISPNFAFAGEELLLGFKNTPIFRYTADNMGTSIEYNDTGIEQFVLAQNYPNPFNPSTNISFNIKEAGFVTLKVYNLLGQEVATLLEGSVSSGYHSLVFDASLLSSGMYLYQIQFGDNIQSKRMMLIK